jgi:ribosome assembly protein YihI (activator of Der GTPase)
LHLTVEKKKQHRGPHGSSTGKEVRKKTDEEGEEMKARERKKN